MHRIHDGANQEPAAATRTQASATHHDLLSWQLLNPLCWHQMALLQHNYTASVHTAILSTHAAQTHACSSLCVGRLPPVCWRLVSTQQEAQGW
jgi:hypothetical protein